MSTSPVRQVTQRQPHLNIIPSTYLPFLEPSHQLITLCKSHPLLQTPRAPGLYTAQNQPLSEPPQLTLGTRHPQIHSPSPVTQTASPGLPAPIKPQSWVKSTARSRVPEKSSLKPQRYGRKPQFRGGKKRTYSSTIIPSPHHHL